MSTEHDENAARTQASPPDEKLTSALRKAEIELLADLATSAREGDWEVVDELFDTLHPLHEAAYRASDPPGPPERPEGPPPPLDPPGGWPIKGDLLLPLAGIEKAVQLAEASALAEAASLAHEGDWKAVWAALPVLELLDFARRRFQR